MKGGPKSSLRPFLHRALQLLTIYFLASCVTVRAFCFRYKAFFAILEHLKLKFSISIH